MIGQDDMAACRAAIRHGSRSFHAASKLLPVEVRDRALALYAFCRLADDAVDLKPEKTEAVAMLTERLEGAYAGRPRAHPIDRAFAAMVEEVAMPRALPQALIEGFAWDAEGRRYQTLSDVRAYAARVAAAVGAMMCVLMGARGADTLARACDLGVAMQLTNITRDIGEDAREGRLYLPVGWLTEMGLDPDRFIADPRPGPEVAALARRMLGEAERLYARAEAGIVTLPRSCRPGIYAARHIYAGIGGRVARGGYDPITARARTTTGDKLRLTAVALGAAAADSMMPRSAVLYARPLPETRFLVEAAALEDPARAPGRLDGFLTTLGQLKARDRGPDAGFDAAHPPAI